MGTCASRRSDIDSFAARESRFHFIVLLLLVWRKVLQKQHRGLELHSIVRCINLYYYIKYKIGLKYIMSRFVIISVTSIS